jgi:hypothetical protein
VQATRLEIFTARHFQLDCEASSLIGGGNLQRNFLVQFFFTVDKVRR